MDPLDELLAIGASADDVSDFEVLVLPENILARRQEDQLVEAQDSINLMKIMRERGLKSGSLFDIGGRSHTLERRGSDLWLGVVYVVWESARNGVLDAVKSYVQERVKSFLAGRSKRKPKSPEIHFVIFERKSKTTSERLIEFEGNEAACIRALDKLRKKSLESKNDS